MSFLGYLLVGCLLLVFLTHYRRFIVLGTLFAIGTIIGGMAIGAVAALLMYIYYLRRGGLVESYDSEPD